MSVPIENQENNYFCNSLSTTNQKCFLFPTIPCIRCSLHFCYLHLWNNLCKLCLKQDLTQDFSKYLNTPRDSLISSLSLLENLNDKMSLEVSKKRFKQKHLKEKIRSLSSFNYDSIKNKIEREIENRKNLETTVINLKNALGILKNHEYSVSSQDESNILSLHLNEKNILELKVQKLIDNVDSLNKELRLFEQYSKIRNFICANCGNKIKAAFSNQIVESCNVDDSIINSVIAFNKIKAKGSKQELSCNCLVS